MTREDFLPGDFWVGRFVRFGTEDDFEPRAWIFLPHPIQKGRGRGPVGFMNAEQKFALPIQLGDERFETGGQGTDPFRVQRRKWLENGKWPPLCG